MCGEKIYIVQSLLFSCQQLHWFCVWTLPICWIQWPQFAFFSFFQRMKKKENVHMLHSTEINLLVPTAGFTRDGVHWFKTTVLPWHIWWSTLNFCPWFACKTFIAHDVNMQNNSSVPANRWNTFKTSAVGAGANKTLPIHNYSKTAPSLSTNADEVWQSCTPDFHKLYASTWTHNSIDRCDFFFPLVTMAWKHSKCNNVL